MNTVQNPEAERGHPLRTFARFFRWLFSWRVMCRCLFVLACLATLTGLAFAVENWRGKQAWKKCRREQEAKGEVLDWNALIPAPVPDDQNIYKAPRMAEWFVKESWTGALSGNLSQSRNTNAPFSLVPHIDAKAGTVLVAEVDIIPSNGPLPQGKPDVVLRFDDPAAREQAAKLLREHIGPCVEGAQNNVIVARPLDKVRPLYLAVQADMVPTAKALAEFLPRRPVPHNPYKASDPDYFQIDPAGSNAFRVSLKSPVYTAADYLAQSQPAVPDLNVLREALKRPYARMDSDYQRPLEHPVPHFVRMRSVAQMLSQRAQCCLLLGQPAAAWHELALIRDMCRMLDSKPASNCPTLVEAMIDVAITGLYTEVIADGLRLQAWREPELTAIQKQLTDIHLLPLVRAAFVAERAASCRTFETYPPAELKKLFFFGKDRPGLWDKLKNPAYLLITFAPRGWMYQNMCAMALRAPLIIHIFDVSNNQVLPRQTDDIQKQMESTFSTFPPYSFLATAATPNFVKAAQTLARNQTLANEAFLACGLERYRLALGQYPETLEALVPQFAERLPHDLIGGQPLQYHRTADSQFGLYSIGWNGKDDGGVPGKTAAEGDWVWP
jgi:hypothetical protein